MQYKTQSDEISGDIWNEKKSHKRNVDCLNDMKNAITLNEHKGMSITEDMAIKKSNNILN